MTKIEETSFFKKIIISIKDFERYPELAAQKITSVLLYIVKLMAIFTIVATSLSVYKIANQIQDALTYFKEEIPNLSLHNHVLQVDSEEPIIIENQESIVQKVILDTRGELNQKQIEDYQNQIQGSENGIIFLKEKVLLKTAMTTGMITYSYEELGNHYGIVDLDKQTILDYFSGSNLAMLMVGFFIINYLYAFILYLISIFMDAILLAILGYMTAILLRLRLKFSAMCHMAVHSLTLPILLNLGYMILQTFTGFQIKYFEAMYVGVAYIYIIAAILMIKSDVMKKQQELAKIIEEQEKVKEEMERQKEEEERRKEEQRKEEKKKQEEEEDKKKTKGKKEKPEDTPQGEHA